MIDRRELTPTKSSVYLSAIHNISQSKLTPNHTPLSSLDNNQTLKQYEALKAQVRQLEWQGRQLSNQAQRLAYENNRNSNQYLQKMTHQEETISKLHKQTNYQLDLLRIKQEEQNKRLRRHYDLKIDQLQRLGKEKDYQYRELTEKQAYFNMKGNELRRGIEVMEAELGKSKDHQERLRQLANEEEIAQKKLGVLTEELQAQQKEMQAEIHVLLDIEADKSREINSLEVTLRNSEANQRALCDKITGLTDNFSQLEHHIAALKEALLAGETRNSETQQQLHDSEMLMTQKEHQVEQGQQAEHSLRKALEREQVKQRKRQAELAQLVAQNQRLVGEVSLKKQQLRQICATH